MRCHRLAGMILAVILSVCAQLPARQDALKRGISLMTAARSLEAERVFRAIPPSSADYLDAQTMLGFLLIERSALAEAEQVFRMVLERQPEYASARLGLGVTLLRRGQPAKGGEHLEQILANPELGLKANAQWVLSLIYQDRIQEAFERAELLAGTYPSHAEFQSLLGYVHQIRGDRDQATQCYEKSVQLDPDYLPTYFDLIASCRLQKDWPNALRWAQNAITLDRNQPVLYRELSAILKNLGRGADAKAAEAEAERTYDAEILYGKAVNARLAGRDGDTEKLLRDCVAKNPRLSKAWIDLGELLQRLNRRAEARQSFRNALESSPQDPRALLGLVASLRQDGRAEEALGYLKKAAEAGKLSADLSTTMAGTLQQYGRTEEAIAAVERALSALPDDPDLLSYLGSLQLSGGRNVDALASYEAALRLNPAQIDALLGQAQARLMQGATRAAVDSLRRAQILDPSNPQVLKALLGAYLKAGERNEAESVCRVCLKLNAKDSDCREQLAWLRLESHDYKEAISHFELLVKNGAQSKRLLESLAYSLMKTGSYTQAIEYYSRSIRQYGPDANVYASLGFLERCVRNLPAAISDYRKARDLAPSDPERNWDLGLALYLNSEFSAAVDPLETALRLKPDHWMAHYHLSLVYWSLGQTVLALAHARLALEHGVREAAKVVQSLSRKQG